MWGLLVWTLLALHRIRATGAQGRRATPTWGWGGCWRRGRVAGTRWPLGGLLDTGLSLGRALSREFQDPLLEFWGLSFGGGAVFLRLVASRGGKMGGGGPCWEASSGVR